MPGKKVQSVQNYRNQENTNEREDVLHEQSAVSWVRAINYSDLSKLFFKTEPMHKLNYRGLINDYYKRKLNMGVHRDLLMEGANLEGYKLLLTPFMPHLSAAYLERALAFVRAGGTWIAGPLTGGRTEQHTIPTDA